MSELSTSSASPFAITGGRFTAGVLLLALATATAARGATITVTGTSDSIAVDGFVTLREAITAANTNAPSGDAPAGSPGLDNIHFNIAGAPGTVHSILPISDLPTITESVFIDGYTQPGSSQNTSATGTNAFLTIELQGTLAGFATGLTINGPFGSTVRGLVINRFTNVGIIIAGGGGNVITGNFIGTDQTGKLDRGNGNAGVRITSAGNIVGGTTLAARNLISGNLNGVEFFASNYCSGTLIQGNLIGTDDTGIVALANSGDAVTMFSGTGITIGGTSAGAGNVIAFNTGTGVVLGGGQSNAVLGNSIHSNGGLGIDVGSEGITPNDALDADSGRQNFPVITSAIPSGGSTQIGGTLGSAPLTVYRIELFSSPTVDPSGNGEGTTYLGFVVATTDGSGNASFLTTVPVAVSPNAAITATATELTQGAFNTSEHSAAYAATPVKVVRFSAE